ncbi:MAG TPA: hypothetical protein VE967_13990 [Gemmatimonadaceae bacterium]|nr:hypothetical protein [Gemmatimonadaceae bacterium]
MWFVVAGLRSATTDLCPLHDGGRAVAAHGGHAQHDAGSHEAMHHGHGAPQAPADHAKHHCTCAGSCCSVAAFVLPGAPAFHTFVVTSQSSVASPASGTLSGRVDVKLPFSTAPPRVMPA